MKVKLIICFILGLLIACMFAICKQDPHQQAEIKILISILKDDNQPSDVRESAADELVTFGPAAVPALIDLIEENEPLVGHRAATLLGRLGPDAREAVPILVELLKNGDSMNCRQVGVLYAEGYQGEPKPGPSQLCVCDTASWALFYIGPNAADAVPELTKILREDERTRVRMNAAEALGGIGAASPDVVPALIQALQDESGNVPYTSAMALCDIGPEAVAAVPKLVALLNDDDSYVRYASIFALKDIGPEALSLIHI